MTGAALCAVLPVAASERIALVIGNAEYTDISPLPNPRNDAQDVADRLTQLGFALHGGSVHLDLTERELLSEIAKFSESADGAEIAFLYYAGHGMQFDGDPHLLPVDVPDERLEVVQREAIGLNRLLLDLAGLAELTVAVFDACREIPDFEQRIQRRSRGNGGRNWRGLSRPVVTARSTLVAYSGGSGELVADGDGRNSPYTKILVEHLSRERIEQEGWDIRDLFSEVSYQFRIENDGQSPELIDQGVRPNHFFLASATGKPSEPEPQIVANSPQSDATAGELEMWRSVQGADRREEYEVFVELFPGSIFSKLARRRIDKIDTASAGQLQKFDVQKLRKPFEPEMQPLPGGCYLMGSPTSEIGRFEDERAHRICVQSVLISSTEVTVKLFEYFIQDTGYLTEAERETGRAGCYSRKDEFWGWHTGSNWRKPGYLQTDSEPVVCVSWNDAVAYTEWLSEKTGSRYRLPTEAEWEYSARAGADAARYWGVAAASACRFANVSDQAFKRIFISRQSHNCDDGVVHTATVASFAANEFGLYDMLGNVAEWTCSERDEVYGGNEKRCKTGNQGQRSLRGGSWDSESLRVRSAYRGGAGTDYRTSFTGFRVARPGG